MSLQHVIRRGDSLWALAGRHLGNPARWPELYNFHNEHVLRMGGNRGAAFRIQNPNVLFVGQTLFLPIRGKRMVSTMPTAGRKSSAERSATPVDLRIEYAFGSGGKPIIYSQETTDSVITAEMRGRITIEMISTDRHRYNLELLMSKDALQCKKKLDEIYSPAIGALASKPDMIFEADRVVIVSPIATGAGMKPYVVNVGPGPQGHLKGGFEPPPAIGSVAVGGRKFNYRAEIEFRVEVQNNKAIGIKPGFPEQRGFLSSVGHGMAKVGEGLYNTFTNKEVQREVGSGFVRAGKAAVLVHTAVVIKAVALHTVSTTPQAVLPITINNMSMALIDGYPPVPPTTAPGVGVAIVSLAVEWALSQPPWKK